MRLTSILAALALVAGLAWWFVLRHEASEVAVVEAPAAEVPAEPASRAEAPVPVLVIASEAQRTAASLTLRGRTEASRRVQVPAQTTGQVISEPIRRGSEVKAGQLLCRLEPGTRAAQLAEAEAALAEAEAEAVASEQLKSKGYAAEVTYKARRAQLEAAQARRDQVEWDIRNLEIFAPFDGVLETDTAELGSLLSQGTYCATVIDLSEIKVTAFVSERDVDHLTTGREAKARLINGIERTGEITFLSRSADPETRTYAVEVTLPNPDGRLRDGMTAELTIALPTEIAHLIPQSALTLDDDGRLGVRIAEGDTARFRAITVLRDEPEGVWVTGLPDRTQVIVSGQEFVRDGRKIVPQVAADQKS